MLSLAINEKSTAASMPATVSVVCCPFKKRKISQIFLAISSLPSAYTPPSVSNMQLNWRAKSRSYSFLRNGIGFRSITGDDSFALWRSADVNLFNNFTSSSHYLWVFDFKIKFKASIEWAPPDLCIKRSYAICDYGSRPSGKCQHIAKRSRHNDAQYHTFSGLNWLT